MAEQTPVSFLEKVSSGKQNRDGRSCYPQLPSKPIWCLRSQQNLITPMASLHDWWAPHASLAQFFSFLRLPELETIFFVLTQSSQSSGSTIPSWFGPPADWVSRLPWANWQNSPFTGEHWNWLVGWMAPPPNGQDEQLKGSNSYWVKSYSHRFPEKNILWPSKDAPQVVSGIQAFICSSLQDIIPIVLYQKNYRERGS